MPEYCGYFGIKMGRLMRDVLTGFYFFIGSCVHTLYAESGQMANCGAGRGCVGNNFT